METSPQTTPAKRLYKSRVDRMIDGVCGGFAEYFEVDPTIVRILWVLLTLLGGIGLILYIAAMIIMPANPGPAGAIPVPASRKETDRKRFWGVLFILIGVLILMTNLGFLAAFRWWHVSWDIMFPIVLILLGVWLMYVHVHKPAAVPTEPTAENASPSPGRRRELRRSVTERKLFGVCAGIARYFDVDPTIVRVLYVLLVLASFGWGLLLYIILAILMPEEKLSATSG